MKFAVEFFICFILLSSNGQAIEKSVAFNPFVQVAISLPTNREPTVKNLPDSFDSQISVCSAVTPYFLLQHAICNSNQNPLNCSSLDNSMKLSVLHLFSASNIAFFGETVSEAMKDKVSKTPRIDITDGGNPIRVLQYFFNVGSVSPESCAPFDQFLNKFGSSTDEILSRFSYFKSEFESLKTKANSNQTTSGGSLCIECLIKASFEPLGLSNNQEQLIQTFKRNQNFGVYLYSNLIATCGNERIRIPKGLKLKGFPTVGKTATQSDVIDKIRMIVSKQGRPVTLDHLCLAKSGPTLDTCTDFHTTTIIDYHDNCGPDNRCVPLVRLREANGIKGQERMDRQWFRLDTLLENVLMPPNEPVIAWISDEGTYQTAQGAQKE